MTIVMPIARRQISRYNMRCVLNRKTHCWSVVRVLTVAPHAPRRRASRKGSHRPSYSCKSRKLHQHQQEASSVRARSSSFESAAPNDELEGGIGEDFPNAPPKLTPAELWGQVRFLVPVVLAEVGFVSLGFVDAVMVSRFSESALAACSLGITYFSFLLWFGVGVAGGAEPLLAQAFGNRNLQQVRDVFRGGFKLCVLVTLPMAAISTCAAPVLQLFSQPPDLIAGADVYSKINLVALFPAYLSTLLQGLLFSTGQTLPVLWAMLVANLANVILNQVLIHGTLCGIVLIPNGLGVVGAAIATSSSRLIILGMLLYSAMPFLRGKIDMKLAESSKGNEQSAIPQDTKSEDTQASKDYSRDVWSLGLPIGGQMLLEWGAFAILPLICGRMSNTTDSMTMAPVDGASEFLPLVVHTVANSLTDLVYMMPLGLSTAATFLCGRCIGEGNLKTFEGISNFALKVVVVYGLVVTLAFAVFSSPMSQIFSQDESVMGLAASVLPAAGIYTLCDGVRTVMCGVLKSAGLTKFVLQSSILGFWILGLPCSMLLAFPCNMGVAGLWLGLAVGNMIASLRLIRRVSLLRQEGLEKYTLIK